MLFAADPFGRAGPHQLQQRIAGRAVAVFLGPFKSLRMHRQHRNSRLLADALAHRFHVVADHADDAGGINKRRLRLVCFNQLAERGVQLLLAAVHHIQLVQVGREAQPVQFRPEESAPRMSQV